MGRMRAAGALLLAFLAAGCGKTASISDTSPPLARGGTSSGGAPSLDCAGPNPGPAPLGRLGNFELNRSLQSLFHDLPTPVALAQLVEDRLHDDPQNEVDAQGVSTWHTTVHTFAEQLYQNPDDMQAIIGSCQALDETKCRDQFLEGFLKRAYRRAVTDEDKSEMTEVFAAGQKLGGDFESGARAVIEVALQTPDFMYLVEQGDGQTKGDSVELSGYESAARLSYFLTGSAPDDELLTVAAQGALAPEALEAQARRLLGSTPNRELVRHFYARLLGLEFLEADAERYFTAELIAAAEEETARFVEDVTFDDGGSYGALLTSPTTWVDGPLARFYGYPEPAGSGFQKIELDPSERMGFLTQAAFLRATSPTGRTSPVHRGLRVLEQMLCYQMPAPPAGLALPSVDPTPDSTTRQRLELATSNPSCQSCHHEINPVGFAFEHYDQLGVWRDTEHGLPIDSSGEIFRSDMQGKFADAIELVKRMAASNDAKACFVSHWLEAAYRRAIAPEDACARQALEQAFAATGDNLVELMVALTKTDNFRYRLKSELTP